MTLIVLILVFIVDTDNRYPVIGSQPRIFQLFKWDQERLSRSCWEVPNFEPCFWFPNFTPLTSTSNVWSQVLLILPQNDLKSSDNPQGLTVNVAETLKPPTTSLLIDAYSPIFWIFHLNSDRWYEYPHGLSITVCILQQLGAGNPWVPEGLGGILVRCIGACRCRCIVNVCD